MVNWFSVAITVGLANIVVGWVRVSRADYGGAAICVMGALLMFLIAWREMTNE